MNGRQSGMSTNRQIQRQAQAELATRKFTEKYGHSDQAHKDIVKQTKLFFDMLPKDKTIDVKELQNLEKHLKQLDSIKNGAMKNKYPDQRQRGKSTVD